MYDEIRPDIVFICVPPTQHGEIEFETIRRGIHFFVEKPVALDLELARSIRDAAEKKGIITASGFQCRYSNLNKPAVDYIRNHEIVYIDCTRIGGVPGAEWWKKRSTSGGQIVEQTIHQFDIIRYLFGEPDTVFSFGAKGFVRDIEGYDTEDLSTTVVRFKNGALATISTGCYATDGAAFDSKITFSAKDSRADLKILESFAIYSPSVGRDSDKGFIIKGDGKLSESGDKITYYQDGDAGILCDRTFIEAVISGNGLQIKSPYADAVRSLAFTLACNQSIDTGLPVKVEI
jgi:predicted dehydrogenase